MRYNQGKSNVLVISDTQEPFAHKDTYEFLDAVDEYYECDEWVHVGDEVDQHALSRFSLDPEANGAGPELRKAITKMQPFYERWPKMKVCHSNHTRRVYSKFFEAGIPEAYYRPVHEWMQAPDGWQWDNYWEVDGVKYEHGDAQGGEYAAKNLCKSNRQSTVIGHHHSHAGVNYTANQHEVIFGMNVGCLIDVDAYAFKYGRNYKFKPTLGCGVVLQGTPQFIPMKTNGKGRWTGDL